MTLYPKWWRQHFLVVERWIAVAIGIGLIGWWKFGDAGTILANVVHGNRSSIYGTMASLCGSLLGFVIATQTIVLGFSTSERLTILKNSKPYKQLWDVFTSTIRVLGATTLMWLLALFFDRDASPRTLLLAFCIVLTFLSILRIARCVWVLERIVAALTAGDGGG